MQFKIKEYLIELINDDNYTLSSADNINSYQFCYFEDNTLKNSLQIASKHGIRIFKGSEEINSVIIGGSGGATTIHSNSFMIKKDTLLLCCSNMIYSLSLPSLKLNWVKQLDPATCFGIYKFEDEFVVHGELFISRIDLDGLIVWKFGGKDIFLHPDGENSFSIINNNIYLKDWGNHTYVLGPDGKEIL